MADIMNNAHHIVRVKDFRIDADYAVGLTEIKRRYHSVQIIAAVKVNTEKLAFNWSVRRDLVMRKAEETWGSGVVEQLSFEAKVKPFDPMYAGKLNYFVNAINELLKGADDNPTTGLLICSDKDETDVRWAFKGIQTPMDVASYDNVQIASPSNLLPSAEELQARVRLVEELSNKI